MFRVVNFVDFPQFSQYMYPNFFIGIVVGYICRFRCFYGAYFKYF